MYPSEMYTNFRDFDQEYRGFDIIFTLPSLRVGIANSPRILPSRSFIYLFFEMFTRSSRPRCRTDRLQYVRATYFFLLSLDDG